MSSKKNAKTTAPETAPSLKIGTRVRCTDDGIEGRIAWANATSVKIRWDDGEEVTWKRDVLPTKPLLFLLDDANPSESVGETNPQPTPSLEENPTPPQPELPSLSEPINGTPTALIEEPEPTTSDVAPTSPESVADQPSTDTVIAPEAQAPAPIKPKRERRPKKAGDAPKEKKPSALDAAARVLAETGQAMSCVELIEAMADKGYWTSPNGKTPAATLYSAILRELQTKGDQSRFVKADRGRFALRPTT